ncbi:conserved Plasmodium protein, unknown function [Plasmodium gallinaceum]|uniref:RING-type domain-containing protein n=1 Tax=Plasmodium gallinaceum TaxID=5849 RepID=A0A1J1GRA2_PLAGA|nr:conserved Plasmodium protein, unknown function [Plasmodium gallinaceum]CRG95063.1 conserved Plasmodium protein, unknown function [Plasmodium gallinaceum]
MYIIPECCICRLSLKNNLCIEKNCGNIFHYECMKKWIAFQKSCPLCKSTCYKKNLLSIHYEISEENKILIDDNIINKSKNELYEDLKKYESELIKIQNENEKYSLEILTLTNKNKILTETISKNNAKINEEKYEKLKLKELKDEYLKEKIILTTKIEEYDKELKKYKLIEKYLDDLNKEDLNKINLLFGFNVLSFDEQRNVILNYIKNSLNIQKKNESVIKELKENISEKDNEIISLKEKLYKYKLNNDIIDSNENNLSNDKNDSKSIKIKNKTIRRVATLESRNKNNRNNNLSFYSKSKTSDKTINNNFDFISFIDKKINSSNSPEKINLTPKKMKFHSIEVDLLRNKSIDKIFNNHIDKYDDKTEETFKKYSKEIEENHIDNSERTTKLIASSPSLKTFNNFKITKSRKRKSLNLQSTKITDFFRRI